MRKAMGHSFILLVIVAANAQSAWAAGRVYLELITEKGFPLTGAQEWAARLNDVGADNVRIRSAGGSERPEIKNSGSEQSPIYRVTGILDAGEVLHLPGARFGSRDMERLKTWVANLKSGGVRSASDRPGAFGLTNTQLLELHTKLAVKVSAATKGQSAGQVVAAISRMAPVDVGVDPSARAALGSGETVPEELLGVSCGTALATVLRPLGLVAVPQRSGTTTRLVVVDSRSSEHSWPIGWAPDKPARDVMPDLYKFVPVEINDFALTDALDALQKRLEVPFLFDHNSLARHGIEPKEVVVSHPKGKTYYKKVIDRLLSQAKLKSEVRVDEAGQPLLWISTVKP